MEEPEIISIRNAIRAGMPQTCYAIGWESDILGHEYWFFASRLSYMFRVCDSYYFHAKIDIWAGRTLLETIPIESLGAIPDLLERIFEILTRAKKH